MDPKVLAKIRLENSRIFGPDRVSIAHSESPNLIYGYLLDILSPRLTCLSYDVILLNSCQTFTESNHPPHYHIWTWHKPLSSKKVTARQLSDSNTHS